MQFSQVCPEGDCCDTVNVLMKIGLCVVLGGFTGILLVCDLHGDPRQAKLAPVAPIFQIKCHFRTTRLGIFTVVNFLDKNLPTV